MSPVYQLHTDHAITYLIRSGQPRVYLIKRLRLLDLYRGDAHRASLQVDDTRSVFPIVIGFADCLVSYADLRLASSTVGSANPI